MVDTGQLGWEREYRAWQERITEAARFPGFLGNEVFPPIAECRMNGWSWCASTPPNTFRNWLQSDVRKRLIDEAARLGDEARVESFSGAFRGWFRSGLVRAGLPPEWKQIRGVGASSAS